MLKDKSAPSFDEKWPAMGPVVLKLLEQEGVTQMEWQELFYAVHCVCLWDERGPARVLDALQDDVVAFVRRAQKRVRAHKDDRSLLKAYVSEWRKFFAQCDYLPMPFRSLETSLANKNPTTAGGGGNGGGGGGGKKHGANPEDGVVRKMMLELWNAEVFSCVERRLRDSAMKLVRAEREGETFDGALVVGVRESYANLCQDADDRLRLYRERFEAAYAETTDAFYAARADEYLRANGVSAYVEWADAKLREEELRALRYLEAGGADALVARCERALIERHLPAILSECARLIEEQDTDELRLMFRLADRVRGGVAPMLERLNEHIVQAGLADMMAAADQVTQDSEKYVERLLALFRKFSALVRDAFADDTRFLTVRDQAYQTVVDDTSVFRLELPTSANGRPGGKATAPESKCPELLANYCDALLRRTPLSKRLTSEQIEARLSDVLLVLKYVKNKDVFMRYHKVFLSRRLILDSSADSEKEEEMVERLREVGMPADYVNKLGRMFQDVKVSEDLNAQFKKGTTRHDAIGIKILNAGAWARGSERVTVSLPVELEDYIPEVEEFYKRTHSGRKLQWYHHMSNGTIAFVNDAGKFDLDVTTLQMAVLFAWNQRPREKIAYENLRLATELPDLELRKTLWSLVASPKIKRQVLLFEPPAQSPKDFSENALFWVNREFAPVKNGKAQKRGKVNLVGRLLCNTERSQTEDNDSIVQLRILRTQEAIIKILKMRKRISNSALQTELIDILKNMFLPSKKMIKEQLEWLIENKYMRREDDDINTFVYMA